MVSFKGTPGSVAPRTWHLSSSDVVDKDLREEPPLAGDFYHPGLVRCRRELGTHSTIQILSVSLASVVSSPGEKVKRVHHGKNILYWGIPYFRCLDVLYIAEYWCGSLSFFAIVVPLVSVSTCVSGQGAVLVARPRNDFLVIQSGDAVHRDILEVSLSAVVEKETSQTCSL